MQRPWGKSKSGAFEKKQEWLGLLVTKKEVLGDEVREGRWVCEALSSVLAAVTVVAVLRTNSNQVKKD